MDIFMWCNKSSTESNYHRWKHMNDVEHRSHNEKLYSNEKSWEVFSNMFKDKIKEENKCG